MVRTQKQGRRRQRISFQQRVREIGPRLRTAFRRARVALWRFKRSPKQQDRAAMYATFAFITLFAIGSVDAVVTGGADFAPHSAYAAEYTPARVATVSRPVEEPETVVEEVAPSESMKAAAEVDYSFTTEELLGGPLVERAVVEAPAIPDVSFEILKIDPSPSEPAVLQLPL
ncbi:MAG: hypothetical protein KF779_11160 [Hyphomonadaceae bacterium]|nr:hypothetical protein [Hyphomonadaceae bacterium]